MSHDAPTVSTRFIYGPTTTHDDSATIYHGGATNAHDASTIRYGASTIQAGSATVASRPSTNQHDLVVVVRQSQGGGGLSPGYTVTILATTELRLTPIYQVVMHRHES